VRSPVWSMSYVIATFRARCNPVFRGSDASCERNFLVSTTGSGRRSGVRMVFLPLTNSHGSNDR
jgi:hypothetical protein